MKFVSEKECSECHKVKSVFDFALKGKKRADICTFCKKSISATNSYRNVTRNSPWRDPHSPQSNQALYLKVPGNPFGE